MGVSMLQRRACGAEPQSPAQLTQAAGLRTVVGLRLEPGEWGGPSSPGFSPGLKVYTAAVSPGAESVDAGSETHYCGFGFFFCGVDVTCVALAGSAALS